MNKTPDITIIGGGIIGLLTARECTKAGACVRIIDKNLFGLESSWAGGGILLPLYPWRQPAAISALVLHSLSLYPELASTLKTSTGIDPEYNRCGLLLTQNPDIEDAINWCQHNKIEHLPPDDALLSPLNCALNNPLWLPSIAQARNPRFLKSLQQDLLAHDTQLQSHCELTGIHIKHNKVTHIATGSGDYPANQVILCTGAWTQQLFKQLFPQHTILPEITPVKGQMVLFDAQPELLNHMVLSGDQYLIPRLDGKILAGSTLEHRGFNKETTKPAKQKLADFATQLFPALQGFPVINHWAGLRPATKRGIPYIDKHPDIKNLAINSGHFRNGYAMGPASAQLMADLLLDRPTSISPCLLKGIILEIPAAI